MPIPISEFALLSQMTPQTLRHYHSEGLLVPEVDSDNGYRHYTFDQVHRAVVISTLRDADVSIADIRSVLDDPTELAALLERHQRKLDLERVAQDSAMSRAHELAAGWPAGAERHIAKSTAVRIRVPGEAMAADGSVVPSPVEDAAHALTAQLASAGITPLSAPWCTYALAIADDRAKTRTTAGPDWFCFVAVDSAADERMLSPDATLVTLPARTEVVISVAEVPSMNIFAAILDHVMRSTIERDLVPDVAVPRYVLGEERVEVCFTIEPLTDADRETL
ncbi:MerR family transcriptional regulator [Marisediminicola sp. LYQ134]|uniref:MerR family transcriptional regulator n=1 Tax=Marisediminicola sp. LYQ134 TaxID=3391061 RepID=UPI003983CF89